MGWNKGKGNIWQVCVRNCAKNSLVSLNFYKIYDVVPNCTFVYEKGHISNLTAFFFKSLFMKSEYGPVP